MTRPAPFVLPVLLALLAVASASTARAAAQAGNVPSAALEATVSRCFELRNSEPAAAVALAESAIAGGELPAETEIKLQACLVRAAALTGDEERTAAAAARIDALLAQNPLPPEFLLRALTNAGAGLHTVGRIHEALHFYARAYEIAARDESDVAQVTTLINVGIIHGEELGAYAEAEGYFARAEAIERRSGEPNQFLHYNRGLNFLRMGRDQDAMAAFREAEARARSAGLDVDLQRARAEIIALEAKSGAYPVAARALEAAAARQRNQQDPSGAALTLLRLSGLALDAGDADAALRHALAAKEAVSGGVFGIAHRDGLQAEVAAHVALAQWPQAFAASEALRRLDVERLRAQQLAGLAGLQARLQDTSDRQELERIQVERQLEALGLANARRLRNGAIAAFCVLALLAGAFFVYQRRVNRKLHRMSTVDSLTGLLNRRAGEAALREVDVGTADGGRRSVVYLIDVDHFKDYNDRFGHAAGDTILSATAARLRAACRPGDIVARWGGEEFLVACRDMDRDRASTVAERLRAAAAASPGTGEAGSVSVSIGFACLPFLPDATQSTGWQESLALADRALYAAKHNGRDAWVGLWGAAGSRAALASVLADPEAHERRGDLTVLVAPGMKVDWPPAPGPGA